MANQQQDTQPNTDPKRAQPGREDQGQDQERMGREDRDTKRKEGQDEDMPRQ